MNQYIQLLLHLLRIRRSQKIVIINPSPTFYIHTSADDDKEDGDGRLNFLEIFGNVWQPLKETEKASLVLFPLYSVFGEMKYLVLEQRLALASFIQESEGLQKSRTTGKTMAVSLTHGHRLTSAHHQGVATGDRSGAEHPSPSSQMHLQPHYISRQSRLAYGLKSCQNRQQGASFALKCLWLPMHSSVN